MSVTLKRRLAIAAAGIAVGAAGGAAYAASSGSSTATPSGQDRKEAFLADVAQRLNVTPDKLKDALRGAAETQLDQAVKDGVMTQAQADRLKQRLQDGALPGFFGAPGIAGGRGGHHRGIGPGMAGKRGLMRDALQAAAKAASSYLGVSRTELKQQLRDGKSLAEIARAQGKDVAGLKTALRKVATDQLAKAVKAGSLTQAQADRFSTLVDEHLDAAIDGGFMHFGMRRHHRLNP